MNNRQNLQRISQIPQHVIGQMMDLAKKVPDLISLGQGTPSFSTPDFIWEALYQESKQNSSLGKYVNGYGDPLLIAEIAKILQQKYRLKVGLEKEIYITAGAISGLAATILAFINKGDEVILLSPGYPLHFGQIVIAGGRPKYVFLDEKNNWSLDITAIKKTINKRTKMVILTHPNNPTGTVFSKEQIKELAKIVIKNNLLLLLDEAYEFLVYDDLEFFSPLQLPELKNNLIVCKSFSKELAMTGWRIGYIYASPFFLEKIAKVHSHLLICAPSISQKAVYFALKSKQGNETTTSFVKEFIKRRNLICQRLKKMEEIFSFVKPQGSYYVFPKYHLKIASFSLAKKILYSAKVITIPGSAFGPNGENHLRLSFAGEEKEINQALTRLEKFFQFYG